jgi:hypothetical protein
MEVNSQHAEQILGILRDVLQGNSAFAVGTETSRWTHGFRFTIYDVRSTTSGVTKCPFDEIAWEIEDALRDVGYPVTAIMKGERVCMLDVDCRAAKLATVPAE